MPFRPAPAGGMERALVGEAAGMDPTRPWVYDAVHDPRQRVIIRPGDHLVLQYSRTEACAAFVERHFLEGLVLGVASSLFYR